MPAQKKPFGGHYDCPGHDQLAEVFEKATPTICRACFKKIKDHHTQFIGSILVEVVLHRHHIIQLESLIQELTEEVYKTR